MDWRVSLKEGSWWVEFSRDSLLALRSALHDVAKTGPATGLEPIADLLKRLDRWAEVEAD